MHSMNERPETDYEQKTIPSTANFSRLLTP